MSVIFWPRRFIQVENTPQAGTSTSRSTPTSMSAFSTMRRSRSLGRFGVVGEEVEEPVHGLVDDRATVELLVLQRLERVAQELDDLVEQIAEDREVEGLLGRPVIVQARDVHARTGRDLARRRAR